MHILPGDHRRSLQLLRLDHRAYEGSLRVLGWFSLKKRRVKVDLMSSHSVLHKRQEDMICKKGDSGLPIKEIFHQECGQLLEEGLEDVVGSPALKIPKF